MALETTYSQQEKHNKEALDFSLKEKAFAWSVHMFTATGVVLSLLSLVAIAEGDFREAMLWLFGAMVIDGIDGTFARKFRVQEVLPHFSGKTVDYVIDFANYAIIPAFFFYQAQLVPEAFNLAATAAMLLVSAYYYGLPDMVSEDMHFVGFPVMWNYVVFYFYFVWDLSPWVNLAILVFFCILHFIPLKFLYPSRTREHKIPTYIFSVIACVVPPLIVYFHPVSMPVLNALALSVIAYFGFMAIYKTYFYYPK